MRAMKRIASVVLAMVMVLAMAVPVMATSGPYADPGQGNYNDSTAKFKIKISPVVDGHTYKAYQIFKGDVYGQVLSNASWGSGVKADWASKNSAETYLDKLKEDLDFDAAYAEEFADMIYGQLSEKATSSGDFDEATKSYTIEVEGPGYYLIVDETAPSTDAHSRFILAVVNNVSVTPKSGTPEVKKKVKDVNDSTGGENTWQDSADYDIGDEIPFQLTGTLPDKETLDAYTKYSITFKDTMTNLTYTGDRNVMVTINGTDVTSSFNKNWEKPYLTISCDDIKKISGVELSGNDVIVVEYTATLDEDAAIGKTGNPNEVTLTYSNNPNPNGEGDTGTTPPDKVIVFTFDLDVDKVDGDRDPLNGAGFTLYKWALESSDPDVWGWKEVKKFEVVEGEEQTKFSFEGLDDGYYKLEESTVPAGYNKADDVLFAIEATHVEDSDAPELSGLVVKELIQEADGSYKPGDEISSGEEKLFSVKMTSDSDGAMLDTDVVNNAGTQLPETGGMGTTIFYVVGAILILGAGILLVTNKRMSK